MLTAHKAINPGWVRNVCASLVKVPSESSTYRAYVRGHELTISLATIVAALGIIVEAGYDYLIRSDHHTVSFSATVIELSGCQQRSWSGETSLPTKHLTLDYHLLHLAIVAYITPTMTKKSLPVWLA